eukprot:6201912-Pleurochrysis_carterae.AAC.3
MHNLSKRSLACTELYPQTGLPTVINKTVAIVVDSVIADLVNVDPLVPTREKPAHHTQRHTSAPRGANLLGSIRTYKLAGWSVQECHDHSMLDSGYSRNAAAADPISLMVLKGSNEFCESACSEPACAQWPC